MQLYSHRYSRPRHTNAHTTATAATKAAHCPWLCRTAPTHWTPPSTGEGDTSNFDDYEAYNPTTYQNKLSASDVAIIKKEGGFGDW